jgi:hypothetical protein
MLSFSCRLRLALTALVLLFYTFDSKPASANLGDLAGFGSRTAALGGAGAAWGFDAFASYYNPAGLAFESDKRLGLSWGLVYMKPSFLPIDNVVLKNNFNSAIDANSIEYESADTQYRSTFGQVLGISYHLLPQFGNLSIGITTFLPIQQLAYMDTGEVYAPEYVLYRARTQRPQFEVGVGAHLGAGFYLGGGMHVAYTLSSNSPVTINTGENTISSMRFASSLMPKAAPYLGLIFKPQNEGRPYSFGAVVRFPVSFDNVMALSSSARLFKQKVWLDFDFLAVSSLYYDPLSIEVGGSVPVSDRVRVFAQCDYQFWNKFKIPALQIEQPRPGTESIPVSPGPTPSFQFSNLLTPRLGTEVTLSRSTTLRLGYSYRPSMIKGSLNESGNYLDPPKHMFGLGLGWELSQFLGTQTPTRFDIHLAYQRLNRQEIIKTPGNEAGDPGDFKIGAPGYQAGGNILGGGISLSLAF